MEKGAQVKKKDKLKNELAQLQQDSANKEKEFYQLHTLNDVIKGQVNEMEANIKDLTAKNELILTAIKETNAEKKAREVAIKQVQKESNEHFQKFTNFEKEARSVQGQILELNGMDSGVVKLRNEMLNEYRRFEDKKKELSEEQQIFVGQLVKKGLEDRTLQGQVTSIKALIEDEEKKVEEMQQHETQLLTQISFLQTIREKMARTASQASTQARETREELKVKELLILDLTKKQ